MFGNRGVRLNNVKVAGHPQMHAEPRIPGKAEEHLFSVRRRAEKGGASERAAKKRQVNAAKNTIGARFDCGNFFGQTRIPLFAKIFNFGQFRHGEMLSVDGIPFND